MKQFLKERVKCLFNTFGLEIHKRYMTDLPLRRTLAEILDHILKFGFLPKTVIDVGVAYGTFDLYEKFLNSSFLLVEPLKEYEDVLKDICRKYKAEYVLALAGSEPGTLILNVHPDLSGSSIFKETEGRHVDGVPREVAVTTLDEICEERNLRGPYLIKADVQGSELSVLDGAEKTLKATEVVILEVSLFGFYVGGPQLYDVVSYMKRRGYVVYDIFGGHNRPLDGALAQLDVAFAKENGRFRKSHFFATREQRETVTKNLIARNPKC